ncbi:hypothetical protein GCM10009716_42000 [Streptomyces sodiiphilus]|uniref:beta-N-acetylhexosaminidase n=1 Tax=Streptomyces sodiiphilus TaxID=226217 RepID=A0ABN2PV21_9ACTN
MESIRVRNAVSGDELATLDTADAEVVTLTVQALDGAAILPAGTRGGKVRAWRLPDSAEMGEISLPRTPLALRFSSPGTLHFVSGSGSGRVRSGRLPVSRRSRLSTISSRSLVPGREDNPMHLVPAPRELRRGPREAEAFVLGTGTGVATDAASSAVACRLRSVLGAATGLPLPPAPHGTPGAITLRIGEHLAARGPEAYELTVDASGVLIEGGGSAGVFWGAQTLRQLLGPDAYRRAPLRDSPWTVAPVRIADAPRFAWRGMMLDVARHFMPKDGVLRYVDLLAAHKLNVLHLHLTDDQGWRVQIERYPRLTEVGAWRARSGPASVILRSGKSARTAATTPATTCARLSPTPPHGTSPSSPRSTSRATHRPPSPPTPNWATPMSSTPRRSRRWTAGASTRTC